MPRLLAALQGASDTLGAFASERSRLKEQERLQQQEARQQQLLDFRIKKAEAEAAESEAKAKSDLEARIFQGRAREGEIQEMGRRAREAADADPDDALIQKRMDRIRRVADRLPDDDARRFIGQQQEELSRFIKQRGFDKEAEMLTDLASDAESLAIPPEMVAGLAEVHQVERLNPDAKPGKVAARVDKLRAEAKEQKNLIEREWPAALKQVQGLIDSVGDPETARRLSAHMTDGSLPSTQKKGDPEDFLAEAKQIVALNLRDDLGEPVSVPKMLLSMDPTRGIGGAPRGQAPGPPPSAPSPAAPAPEAPSGPGALVAEFQAKSPEIAGPVMQVAQAGASSAELLEAYKEAGGDINDLDPRLADVLITIARTSRGG